MIRKSHADTKRVFKKSIPHSRIYERNVYAAQWMRRKPNIAYILADNLGYGDVSSLNENGNIKTENIDSIAEAGMVFTDAHSGSAVSTPTRYGIVAGRYAWRTHLKRGVLGGWSKPLIKPDRMTAASMLKTNGYNTGCVGKWHLG